MIDCSNTQLTWETLARMLAGVSGTCPGLRTLFPDGVTVPTNYELRDDGGLELRDDGGIELRD